MPPSNKTYRAWTLAPLCPAPGRESSASQPVNEDCLRATVIRRSINDTDLESGPSKKLLPVAIFVHGEDYPAGSLADEDAMRHFVSLSLDDIVAVTFNYRVGVLGFLPVGEEGADGSRLDQVNLGLRDQQMLFEWVQQNIEAFGGDKDQMTMIGVGAGAKLASQILMSYAFLDSACPFKRAIFDSGAPTSGVLLSRDHSETQALLKEFLDYLRIGYLPQHKLLPALRAMPLQKLMYAASEVGKINSFSTEHLFQPVIDASGCTTPDKPNRGSSETMLYRRDSSAREISPQRHHYHHRGSHGTYVSVPRTQPRPRNCQRPSDSVIADLPISALEHGSFPRIPILTGFTTNEGAKFIPTGTASDTDADFRAFFRNLIPGLSDADLDELSMLYPDPENSDNPDHKTTHSDRLKRDTTQYASVPPGKGPQWARLEAAYSDYAYICPVLQTAAFLSSPSAPRVPNTICPPSCCKAPHTGSSPAPDTTFPQPPRGGSVYLYQYAAVSGPLKMANHGDSFALASHDMGVIDPDGKTHPYPGLMAIGDAMHGAWSRFVATGEVEDGGLPWKPVSGLSPWVAGDHQKREFAGGETPGAHAGIMVFGEGNDELAGGNHTGIAAKMGEIGEERMRKCQFWWPRVELSEGMGVHRQSQHSQGAAGEKRAKSCKC